MEGIMFDFFQNVGYSMAHFWGTGFLDLLKSSMYIENEIGVYVMSIEIFHTITTFIYSVSTGLLILKTVWKGTKVYLLNRDGDSEVSPVELLKGYVIAIITAVAFPLLYDYLAQATIWIGSQIVNYTNIGAGQSYSLNTMLDLAGSLVDSLMYIVFFVYLIMFYFSFLKRGVELLILRIGLPLACLGLIDSDNGCFKPYIQQIFKCALTSIVQLFCIEISILIVISSTSASAFKSTCFAFVFLLMAKSTPALLNQFMITTQGGGAIQKVSSFAMTANAMRGFIK